MFYYQYGSKLKLNDMPALNVFVSFDPLPKVYEEHAKGFFPLNVPIIENRNPFRMDLFLSGHQFELFGKEPIELVLEYEDITGRHFDQRQPLDPIKSINPINIGDDYTTKLNKSLAKISEEVRQIRLELSEYLRELLTLSTPKDEQPKGGGHPH